LTFIWVSSLQYFGMFIRRKKNIGGSTSIQIIDKSNGKYKVIKTLGSSTDSKTVEQLFNKAQEEIETIIGRQHFNFEIEKEKDLVNTFFNAIEEFRLLGPELLLGKIFNQIGFDFIQDDLFRHIVITRLVFPVSKLKTSDYLFKHKGFNFDFDKVYRYLDKLHTNEMNTIQQIRYQLASRVMQKKHPLFSTMLPHCILKHQKMRTFARLDIVKTVNQNNLKLY